MLTVLSTQCVCCFIVICNVCSHLVLMPVVHDLVADCSDPGVAYGPRRTNSSGSGVTVVVDLLGIIKA